MRVKVVKTRRERTPALCPWNICARLKGQYRAGDGFKREKKLEGATVKYLQNRRCSSCVFAYLWF